ncbi:MAG TPA: guanine deaminase, partial [Arcobacter sp.]|nr:guanine deaminase [Arcobacter sp.]
MKNIYRSKILYFTDDPSKYEDKTQSFVYYEDGILITENGRILFVGEYTQAINTLQIQKNDIDESFKNNLIIPGFIDTHVHYPQTEIIGSFGEQLLLWLEKYTFPTEMKFQDTTYSKKIAEFFVQELFKNGTTSAMVYTTVFKESCDTLFEVANKYNMRILAGKILMDRNVPDKLQDTAQLGYEDSEELIKKWHEKNRLLYTITPRFAPTSTKEQLNLAGNLKEKYPSTYIQTHLSENKDEIKWVKSLYPDNLNYLDVYDSFGLVTSRSVFGHCIHLEQSELQTLKEKKASVSLCPTSNLFLGSGLFKIRELKQHNIKIGFGTDVGAGTSFNMFKTLSEAYKIVSLEQNTIDRKPLGVFEAFYQATLGASISLKLENKIGKLETDYEADFIVLDFAVNDLMDLKIKIIEENNKNSF